MSASILNTGQASSSTSESKPALPADIDPEELRSDTAGSSYQSPSADQLLPPPNFRPFFTLVEDAVTGEHYHPAVHYFFSDDDPDGLTSCVLDTMQSQPDPDHRLLLIDVAKDGRTLSSAHSLNSVWQISNSNMVPAPSWTDSGPATTPEGLMLKVEGQEAQKIIDRDRRQQKSEDAIHRMEMDIEAYMERLALLQNMLAEAEGTTK